jgi:hypothetical protein
MEITLHRFTERTLKVEGWYYFFPAPREPSPATVPDTSHLGRQPEGFIQPAQDTIDDGDLHCRKYAGTYVGPYPVPELTRDQIHRVEDV